MIIMRFPVEQELLQPKHNETLNVELRVRKKNFCQSRNGPKHTYKIQTCIQAFSLSKTSNLQNNQRHTEYSTWASNIFY